MKKTLELLESTHRCKTDYHVCENGLSNQHSFKMKKCSRRGPAYTCSSLENLNPLWPGDLRLSDKLPWGTVSGPIVSHVKFCLLIEATISSRSGSEVGVSRGDREHPRGLCLRRAWLVVRKIPSLTLLDGLEPFFLERPGRNGLHLLPAPRFPQPPATALLTTYRHASLDGLWGLPSRLKIPF